MAADLQSTKVVAGDGNAHSTVNAMVTAVQASLNAIGDSSKNDWADGLIFDPAKIQQTGAATSDWLAWDGAKWDNAVPAATTAVVLADTTLTSNATTFDFTSISGSYKHLLLVGCLRSDRTSSVNDNLGVRFNNDSTAIYDAYSVQYKDTTPTVNVYENRAATSAYLDNHVPAVDASSSEFFSTLEISIPHYAGAANNKMFTTQASTKTSTATGGLRIFRGMAAWRSSAAITRITLLPLLGTNFTSGSRLTLYGY